MATIQKPVTGCYPVAHVHRWKQYAYNAWYCRYGGCPEKVIGPGRRR